jgi:hypothetical protein
MLWPYTSAVLSTSGKCVLVPLVLATGLSASSESRHSQAALPTARAHCGKTRKPDLPVDNRVCPVWLMVSKGRHD